MSIAPLLAQEFHDIAPPVDYSLVSPWLIFAIVFVALTFVGLLAWFLVRKFRKPKPVQTPRERALESLQHAHAEIQTVSPYEFSIRVSDILRRYVTEQYDLPVTRQTSVEFLDALAKRSPFSDDDRSLLTDFLNRCDLIKFARYEATTADSELLLDEAVRFVKGGVLEPA